MKLPASSKSEINKDENGANVFHLKIEKIVLIHFNIINNDQQKDSRVLCTFVPDKPFGQLLDNLPKNVIFLKTFDSEFSYIEVSFTDKNSKSLEVEVIKSVKCKK